MRLKSISESKGFSLQGIEIGGGQKGERRGGKGGERGSWGKEVGEEGRGEGREGWGEEGGETPCMQ